MRRRTLLTGAAATAAGLADADTAAASGPRAGLDGLLFADTRASAPLTLEAATTQLAAAGRAYATCRYAQLLQALPALLTDLQSAHRNAGGHRRQSLAEMLTRAYVLASSLSTKLGDDAVAWVLADRALTAARTTGSPLTTASAAHRVAIAMRREGHHSGAVALLASTANQLGGGRGDAAPEVIGAFGSLLCTAAYSSAQAGDTGNAMTFIDEAAAAAARLGRPVTGVVPFDSTTVAIYRIGVCTALGDTPAALAAARGVAVAELPGPERYGRYCIDTARAWIAHGRPERAVQALLAAEQHAPEEVDRPSVRDLVAGLLYAPTATPDGLRKLAVRLGVS